MHKHRDELPDQGEKAPVSGGKQRQSRGGGIGTVAPVSQDPAAHNLRFRIVAAEYVAQRLVF
jgi:hypothetical protein